jgi:hypothetical protein
MMTGIKRERRRRRKGGGDSSHRCYESQEE